MTDKKIQRPIGITILTSLDVISMSILPLAMLYMAASSMQLNQILQLGFFSILSTLVLSIAIALAAYKTFEGNVKAKNILLILITIYVGLIIFNNVSVMLNPQLLGFEQFNSKQLKTLEANIFRPAIMLLINFLYFNSKKVTEYFQS
jgi:hypothetical protein